MKKLILFLFSYSSILFAQELRQEDGLRYSFDNTTGTARFRAMGGAFGALGGDLSAININPAGSVFFNNNYATVTGSSSSNNNKASYFNGINSNRFSDLNLNQLGMVLVFNDANDGNDWNKISFGLNYETTKDFDNEIFISGTNPSNSISNYFLNFAQGIPESDLAFLNYSDFGFQGQQALLGYQTFLFDPDSSNPNMYVSNVPPGSFYQENLIAERGYNSKITGNFAASYKNKLFLGINLNAHFTDYTRTTYLFERNNNNPNLGVQNIYFENQVYTYGSGFSLNLGAIAKVTDNFRVGIAYESPTWYRLNDELIQGIEATSTDGSNTYNDAFYPNVVNIYPTYRLQTPSKLTGSAAYIFGKNGLLSLDVARKDYSQIEFRPSNEIVYQNINIGIGNSLTEAIEIRLGGEYKYKEWSFRLGYRQEESPYTNSDFVGDLKAYSGGIGYNFRKSRLDLAYSQTQRDFNQYLISSGMNDTARVENTLTNIVLSYSINF